MYTLKHTAVALFIFNRYETLIKVFKQIRQAKPPRLYIIADGPRRGKDDDYEACIKCRSIVECVDWDCKVYTNFSEENLGCGMRPKTGYDWVFKHEEEAIFLEDDCLPNNSFFRYCEEMLEKYRNDSRVMLIGGTNFQPFNRNYYGASYYFSNVPQTWGWATWKRTWNLYDYNLGLWPKIKSENKLDYFRCSDDKYLWSNIFDAIYSHKDQSVWDTQLLFAMWINRGLCVLPAVNMVSHIGIDGTHAHQEKKYDDDSDSSSFRPTFDLEFPLIPPSSMLPCFECDMYMLKRHRGLKAMQRFKLRIKRYINYFVAM